jgi:succinate dehydrogenase hydrophobic anchor subunit
MKEAAGKSDGKAFMENHIIFHETIIKASGNDVLVKVLDNLRMHSMWYRFAYQYYKWDFQRSSTIHQKILDLFWNKNSDEQEIENTVRGHIEIALERFWVTWKSKENRVMKIFRLSLFSHLEWALAMPVIFHALNGGRLILYEAFGYRNDESMIRWASGLSTIYALLLGTFMIMGN